MSPMDPWGEAYLRLAFRLEKHVPGYIDAYFGPAEIREAVQQEAARPPAVLVQEVADLRADLSRQGYEGGRVACLEKLLLALETMARKAAGETFGYREEVQRCFDISPEWVDEGTFQAAHAELEEVLPGGGTLRERMKAYRDRWIVAEDRVLPLVQTVLAEVQRRTRELLALPEGEGVEVTLVRDQPWGAYNWYLGSYRSRIELNTDLPTRALHLLELFAHEAYPGHHTESSVKEHLFYREKGYAEACIFPLNTPASVMAEGIGNAGVRVIFGDAERIEWKNQVLYPQAGLEPQSVEQAVRMERASEKLRFVGANAALALHEKGWPAERVVEYREHYALDTHEEAEHSLQFLRSPLFRAYIFCYSAGEVLIEAAMERVEDGRALFRRLLREAWTPSALAALGRGDASSP